MKVTITIDTDNDGFLGNMNGETARILRVIAMKLERDEFDVHVGEFRPVMDSNGNTVGKFTVKG